VVATMMLNYPPKGMLGSCRGAVGRQRMDSSLMYDRDGVGDG